MLDELQTQPESYKRLTQIELAGLGIITIELAIGERALKLKEMNKEVQKFSQSKEESKQLVAMCDIIAEFSSFDNSQSVRNMLTDLEIMDLYFSIQGDSESLKKMIALTK